MKRLRSLLGVAAFLTASVLIGAEQQNRIFPLAFDRPAAGLLYGEEGSTASPRTTFQIECLHDGVSFRFDAEKACDVKSTLEMFIQTSSNLPNGNYYQFYTEFADPDAAFTASDRALLAQRGVPGDFHPSLRIHYSYFTERLPEFPYLKDFRTRLATHATGCTAKIFIPWNALARMLPFAEDGRGRPWRFGVFRTADGVPSAWQGRPHKAPTWGSLVFPDISLDRLADIYRTIALQNTAKTEPMIDPTLFDPASIPGGLAAQEKERAALEKKIPPAGSGLSLLEMKALATATDRMRRVREVLTVFHAGTRMEWKGWVLESVSTDENGTESAVPLEYIPGQGYVVRGAEDGPDPKECRDDRLPGFDKQNGTVKFLRLRHVFPEAIVDRARLTDLCAVVRGKAPRTLQCTITLNDKPLVSAHDPVAAPAHIDLPSIAKGDHLAISLREAEGLAVNFLFFCRVETERFGLIPRAPINHDAPRPLDKMLPVKKDNEYNMHFAGVYAGELSRLLQEKPRAIQFGGWFEIGFQLNDEPRRKELYDKYRLTHVGNISDNSLVTNLKLEQYPLEILKPSMIILNANNAFSNDPENARIAMQESIRIVRQKAPDARIVILGIVPRPKSLNRATILNPVIARLADEENIPYRDVFPIFLDDEGKVRKELFLPIGYLTTEGYRLWTEILVPDLESTKL